MVPGFIKRLLRRRFGETTPLRRVLYLKNGETKVSKTEIEAKVFNPENRPDIGRVGVAPARANQAEEFFVQDLRGDNDASLQVVPRITSYAQLREWFGVIPLRQFGWDTVPVGGLCQKLVGFYLRSGVAAYVPEFEQQDGSPFGGVRVVRSWPGAPAPQSGETYLPAYAVNGVAGWTNPEEGVVGFGYSGGSILPGKGQPGPDMIFPLVPQRDNLFHGDAAAGLGWYGGTDHLTVNPIFQIVEKIGGTTPPPPPPADGNHIKVVINNQVVGRIPILAPATIGANALEIYENGTLKGKVIF